MLLGSSWKSKLLVKHLSDSVPYGSNLLAQEASTSDQKELLWEILFLNQSRLLACSYPKRAKVLLNHFDWLLWVLEEELSLCQNLKVKNKISFISQFHGKIKIVTVNSWLPETKWTSPYPKIPRNIIILNMSGNTRKKLISGLFFLIFLTFAAGSGVRCDEESCWFSCETFKLLLWRAILSFNLY